MVKSKTTAITMIPKSAINQRLINLLTSDAKIHSWSLSVDFQMCQMNQFGKWGLNHFHLNWINSGENICVICVCLNNKINCIYMKLTGIAICYKETGRLSAMTIWNCLASKMSCYDTRCLWNFPTLPIKCCTMISTYKYLFVAIFSYFFSHVNLWKWLKF